MKIPRPGDQVAYSDASFFVLATPPDNMTNPDFVEKYLTAHGKNVNVGFLDGHVNLTRTNHEIFLYSSASRKKYWWQ